VLPWVNFHATKNYYQMARLVEEAEFPATFNFSPCLLEQIQDYAQGFASDPFQLALELPPERLSPYELERLRKFIPNETRPSLLQKRALESFFSPLENRKDDKHNLLNRQKEILQGLVPLYKKLLQKKIIELTVSPYYHALLPLVFDLDSAGDEKPPSVSFRHPEDGCRQIHRGWEYFRETFSEYPRGFWPSEGGMSREVAKAIAEAGFAYTVTDENILWKSLDRPYDRRYLFVPHMAEGLTIFFRDRELSDLVGFEYQRWNEQDAVDDFLHRLEERRRFCDEHSVVVLALDGENPWGAYRENGLPFLTQFFSRLKEHSGITPVFFEDYLHHHKALSELSLVPGTWLGNFSKWVGSEAKNRSWMILGQAREACGPIEEIMTAEGSDWFWWSGEGQTEEFAFLFKSYIREAYHQAGISYE
jgi:alpha-amylase/alpha-mannosidase (GH57 family)